MIDKSDDCRCNHVKPAKGTVKSMKQDCLSAPDRFVYDRTEAMSFIKEMPKLRETVDKIPDEEGLILFGKASPSREALIILEREIRRLSEDNHKVSLLMADLRSGSGAAFQPAIPMCSQSTIKAIYAGALLESHPAALPENRQDLYDSIVLSSNEAYARLRETYGKAVLEKWCMEAGVDLSFARDFYPRGNTARDMFKMWTKLYCFLNSKNQPKELTIWLSESIASATRESLGDRYPVQTQAGWECGLDESLDYDPEAVIPADFTDGDPLNDECAINDTGIVYTDQGPYLFVIYTDHPFGVFRNRMSENPLPDLVKSLCKVKMSMRG